MSPYVRESRRVLDSGFHTVDSGFRVLDSGFQLSVCFNAFLCISFTCSNHAVLKNVVRKQNKFAVFFFDLQIMGLNVLHSLRVYDIIL